jgi:ribose/xylose/arabinose/galactoside ABC-type transport system permease subunit
MNNKTTLVIGALRPWLVLFLVCAGFSLHPGFLRTFWTLDYLPTILQQASINIILATGMTFVILTGGIDLSVGSVLALCGVALGLTAKTGPPPFLAAFMALPLGIVTGIFVMRSMQSRMATPSAGAMAGLAGFAITVLGAYLIGRFASGGVPLTVALIAALGVGLACGLTNGMIVSLARVPSFVVTLGMLTAARGLTVYATNGESVSALPPALGALGEGLPLVIIAAFVVIAGAVLQSLTVPGRYIQAVGANEQAARFSGVEVAKYQTLAYALSGLTAAIAAIVLTAKFQTADTGAGAGAELNAIAAVVIGGASLSGGRGSVVGSLVGALTIAVLNSGLVLVKVPDTLQGVIIGIVIVAVVMIDQIRRKDR